MAARDIVDPGDVFAGYTIERLLGIGGMGTVYRARDPELPRSVALKLLHRDLTANDYVRSRFELETAHAASLEHPDIVTIYRRGRGADQLWIAMQFIDSKDAAEVVREGPLPPSAAVHIVTETRGRWQSPTSLIPRYRGDARLWPGRLVVQLAHQCDVLAEQRRTRGFLWVLFAADSATVPLGTLDNKESGSIAIEVSPGVEHEDEATGSGDGDRCRSVRSCQ